MKERLTGHSDDEGCARRGEPSVEDFAASRPSQEDRTESYRACTPCASRISDHDDELVVLKDSESSYVGRDT